MARNALFDEGARSYDRARRQLVPCFDDFYGTVLNLIPYERHVAIRVMDLGAGTGILSRLIADSFPNAHVTLVDVSEAMLREARQRLAAEPTRFDFCILDLAEEPLCGEYHAIVSALSIHHIGDEAKLSIFRQVYDVLIDGGIFINAYQVRGVTPEIDRQYHEAWLRQVREKGVAESDLNAALERMREDSMATLASQTEWLEEVGFQAVNCWYKSYGFVVYSGVKGTTSC